MIRTSDGEEGGGVGGAVGVGDDGVVLCRVLEEDGLLLQAHPVPVLQDVPAVDVGRVVRQLRPSSFSHLGEKKK